MLMSVFCLCGQIFCLHSSISCNAVLSEQYCGRNFPGAVDSMNFYLGLSSLLDKT